MPKVSILVPTYNVAPYLRQCMDSVIRQTLTDIEIICVNDGSLEILNEYAEKDNRITVVNQENGGYGKAMNVATAHASGDYIGIVEPDDFIAENMYEVLYDAACKHDLDFVKADFFRFVHGESDDPNDIVFTLEHLTTDKSRYNIVFNPREALDSLNFVMNTWSGIYKRSFIREYNIVYNETPGASFQDNGFYFQTFAFAKKAMILDIPLYRNRRDRVESSVKSTQKVWAMNIEYDFIRNQLIQHEDIWTNIKSYYWKKKWDMYDATANRIDVQYLHPYIERWAKEFLRAWQQRELSPQVFLAWQWSQVQLCMDSPNDFFELKCAQRSVSSKDTWLLKNTNFAAMNINGRVDWLIGKQEQDDRNINGRVEQEKCFTRGWIKRLFVFFMLADVVIILFTYFLVKVL